MAEALYKWGAGENRSCSSGKSPLLRHWSLHTAGVLELQRFKQATAQAALRAVLHDMRDAVRCSSSSDSNSSSNSSSSSSNDSSDSNVPQSSNGGTTADSNSTGSRRPHRLQRRRVHDPTQPLHILVRREQQWCDALLSTLQQFSIKCEPQNSEGWIVLPANNLQQFCTSQQ
jgi:hypothetical protein